MGCDDDVVKHWNDHVAKVGGVIKIMPSDLGRLGDPRDRAQNFQTSRELDKLSSQLHALGRTILILDRSQCIGRKRAIEIHGLPIPQLCIEGSFLR